MPAARTAARRPAEGAAPYDLATTCCGRAGVDRPDAADPGAGRGRDRLQAGRGGDQPAQPRARPARPRPLDERPGVRAARAHVRRRRRRVRRRRGAGRARGPDPVRDPVLRRHRGRATCIGCWSRRPAGSCPRSARTWAATPSTSCASATSTSGCDTRIESCVGGHVVLDDGDEIDTATLVWTAGVKANPVLADTDLPLDDKRPAPVPRQPHRRRRRRTCWPPATAPRSPT